MRTSRHADGRLNTSRTRVVLLLVELAGLDGGAGSPNLSTPTPALQQAGRVVPLDELRADDAGVRAVRLLDQQADRVGLERDVVVQEAEEAGALDQLAAPRWRPPP